jgi:ketosteroid isomerase-like protein
MRLALLVCGLAAPLAAQTADPVPASVVTALDAANRAFSAAFVAGDSAAMAQAYTADAVLHLPDGRIITDDGRVDRFWRPRPGSKLGHRLEPTLRRVLAPDVVLEMGRWHDRPDRGSEAESPWSSGCYTVIWRRDGGGRWRMLYDGWTPPVEAETGCRPPQ